MQRNVTIEKSCADDFGLTRYFVRMGLLGGAVSFNVSAASDEDALKEAVRWLMQDFPRDQFKFEWRD